jgi:hypothetical protein
LLTWRWWGPAGYGGMISLPRCPFWIFANFQSYFKQYKFFCSFTYWNWLCRSIITASFDTWRSLQIQFHCWGMEINWQHTVYPKDMRNPPLWFLHINILMSKHTQIWCTVMQFAFCDLYVFC